MIDKLIFRAFRAIEEPDTCIGYREGHVSVLKDYGVTGITTNNDEWFHNPNVYGIVAQLVSTGEIVGGIRAQISDENTPLPIEKALGKMDPVIYDIVKNFRDNGGCGELCGLWNAKSVAGIGISILLTRAAISTTNQLDFETLMGICAEYTMDMFKRVGFVVNPNLGLKGEYPYPNENYITRVLGIMNATTLATANEYDKMRMKSLREFPTQTATEMHGEHKVEVQYNLIYKTNSND